MQFITWDKFYEKNKNNITDKQAAYEEYLRLHRSFIESVFPKPKWQKTIKSPQNNNINIYNYYGNQGNPQ
jgi:hypothetical protein